MGNAFAQGSAAVHWCWVTAELYEDEIFLGAIAGTQACCEPFLQSSTQLWGLHFAPGSAAAHWCWVIAQLYQEQILIGLIAEAQGCCQPCLQSSTEQWGMHLPKAVLQCIGVGSLQSCMKTKSS